MTVAEAIAAYGYPLVLVGAIAEGETILVAAGYLVHRHDLSLLTTIAFATVGGALGDQIYFLLGRRFGDKILVRLPHRLRARVSQARAAVQNNPVRVLLVMRFAYGMRILLPILCGMSAMRQSRYLRYNVATAVVWATLFTSLGYAFGAAAATVLHEVSRYEMFALAALVVLMWAFHRALVLLRERRRPVE